MKRKILAILAVVLCIGLIMPFGVMADEDEEEEEEEMTAEVIIIGADGDQAELGVVDESIIIEVDGL